MRSNSLFLTLLVCLAAHAAAAQQPASKKDKSTRPAPAATSGKPAATTPAPAPALPTTGLPSPAAPAELLPLPVLTPAAAAGLDLGTLPLPDVPLKPTGYSLGIYRLVHPGQPDEPLFNDIEAVLRHIAEVAPNVKSTTYMATPPKACDIDDDSCFALLGAFQQLDLIVLGSLTRAENGLALRIRLIDVTSGKRLTQAQQIVASNDKTEIKAWSEALGCKLMIPGGCMGSTLIDLDLPEMQLIVDNSPQKRTGDGKAPEKLSLPVGPHRVRVTVGQRTSLERTLPILREPQTTVSLYARQFEQGGLSLLAPADLPLGLEGKPAAPKSVRPKNTGVKWTTPAGYVVAGVGVLAAGFGAYEGMHAKSLSDDANASYAANGGAFRTADVANLNSVHTSKTLQTVGFIAGGALIAVGLTMVFAF